MIYTWAGKLLKLIPRFTTPYKVSLKSHFQYAPKASHAIRRNTHSPREESAGPKLSLNQHPSMIFSQLLHYNHLYTPSSPENTRQFGESSLAAQQTQITILIGIRHHISIWPPARCAQAPYNLREASIP
ncbi:hypothetical protein VN97_g5605 [Penicillium thymicola]|uniref:Uncharacterized protein n=1 Tax=Penicillium thymicola TaxID=293382 RepID=A0AAI9TIG7_PENTH|nr:hypothetical protein VN97_g5605 [Penicillium thymicola]